MPQLRRRTSVPSKLPVIASIDDLTKLVSSYWRGQTFSDDVQRHVVARATALNALDKLPETWRTTAHEDLAMSDDSEVLMEKSDSRVDYRMATDLQVTCGTCRFFDPAGLCCNLVEGTISASCVCGLHTPALGMVWNEQQIFIESELFATGDFSKPQWIPFLPKPGSYEHPKYGKIELTADQNRQMVSSVKNHVYQEHIPIDAEHETKLSGAMAWLNDMRMNDDGSADAYVEFTDRGQSLLESGNFKYMSPEWFRQWTDPATNVEHKNVVAGGAITTRPFFKDKSLRALVASEDGIKVIGEETGDTTVADDKKTTTPADDKSTTATEPPKDDKAPVTFTEAEVADKIKAAVEAAKTETETAASATFTERLVAAETLAASEKTANEALRGTVSNLLTERRTQRFTDLVQGKGETDGARWFGETTEHVSMLESLVGAFGEDSDQVKAYIKTQTGIAAQIRSSELFKEFGSSIGGEIGASAPEARLKQLAEEAVKADTTGKLQFAEAYTNVLGTDEGKRLYSESLAPSK